MDSSSLIHQWLEALQASGYRLTAPRRAIVELIAQSSRALGPTEIYDRARKDTPGMGLVTVYRTLEKLEELDLVQRVHQPGGCHAYIRAAQTHEHVLLCVRCGRYQYFEGDDLSALFGAIAADSGYTISDHWLQLFGICPECQGKKVSTDNTDQTDEN